MKITHNRRNVYAATFTGLNNMSDIAEYTRTHYDPLTFTCKEVCEGLAEMYSNLIPVEVDVIMFRGEVRLGGHWVCKVKGTNYILDPTSDQFDYDSVVRLKRQVSPWLFVKGKTNGDRYFSMNHSPYYITSDFQIQNPTDEELLKIMRYPFYQQLKCIEIDD